MYYKNNTMRDVLVYVISCVISLLLFFTIIPKQNPYFFPKSSKIDKYMYIDDNGVCYKYVRKYI